LLSTEQTYSARITGQRRRTRATSWSYIKSA